MRNPVEENTELSASPVKYSSALSAIKDILNNMSVNNLFITKLSGIAINQIFR